MKRWEKINLLGFFIACFAWYGPLFVDYNILHNRDGYGPLTYYVAIPLFIIGISIFTLTLLKHGREDR